jgi:hypothetical protein
MGEVSRKRRSGNPSPSAGRSSVACRGMIRPSLRATQHDLPEPSSDPGRQISATRTRIRRSTSRRPPPSGNPRSLF